MELSRRGFIGGTLAAATVTKAFAAEPAPAYDLKDYRTGALGKYVGELAPGRYDAHTHVYPGEPDPDKVVKSFAEAGLTGGLVFSRCPNTWQVPGAPLLTPEEAMGNVIAWCSGSPSIYPFYWIDPGADNAVDLVDMAVEKGIYGFKVIRNNGMPCDGPALECYRRMAHWGRPVTFHSGILYDGVPSSEFFRPLAFEPLLRVPRLRFCLAHVSWPWCDECLALFGKMSDAAWMNRGEGEERSSETARMFIDTTPGAHGIWRRDALMHIYQTHFRKGMFGRLMFGIDNSVHDYVVSYSRKYQDFDDALFREWNVTEKEIDSYYRGGLQNFLFGDEEG